MNKKELLILSLGCGSFIFSTINTFVRGSQKLLQIANTVYDIYKNRSLKPVIENKPAHLNSTKPQSSTSLLSKEAIKRISHIFGAFSFLLSAACLYSLRHFIVFELDILKYAEERLRN